MFFALLGNLEDGPGSGWVPRVARSFGGSFSLLRNKFNNLFELRCLVSVGEPLDVGGRSDPDPVDTPFRGVLGLSVTNVTGRFAEENVNISPSQHHDATSRPHTAKVRGSEERTCCVLSMRKLSDLVRSRLGRRAVARLQDFDQEQLCFTLNLRDVFVARHRRLLSFGAGVFISRVRQGLSAQLLLANRHGCRMASCNAQMELKDTSPF